MKNRLETRVGLFFVLAALAAVLMLEVSDNFSPFNKTYVLYADYNNVNELKEGDPVKLSGVQIGRVESIALGSGDRKSVRVTLRVGVAHQDRIKSDSVATIKFTGLMGQNFVAIQPGLDSVAMEPGSLLKSQEMADLNSMLSTMNDVASGIEAVTDSFKGVKIDSIVGPMAKFLQLNTNRMYNIVGNMETITRQLAEGKGVAGQLLNDEQLYNSLNTTVANMEKISKLVANGEGTIGKLVQDDKLYTLLNKTAEDFSVVAADLKSVTAKVAKGEGTMGKLLHEDELYNSLTATAKSLEDSSAKLDKLVTNTGALVTDARSTVDAVSDAANSAKSALAKVDMGEGTLGKLVNQDVLYAESTEAMKNLREIMQKINRGDGSLGMLVNDDSLFKSARATLQKVDNATETMEDQGPISIIGVMFNGLF